MTTGRLASISATAVAIIGMALMLDLGVLLSLGVFGLGRGRAIFADDWAWLMVEKPVLTMAVSLACASILESAWIRRHTWVMVFPAVALPIIIPVWLPLMIVMPVGIMVVSISESRVDARPSRTSKVAVVFMAAVTAIGLVFAW